MSPKDRVVGTPSKSPFHGKQMGGDPITTYPSPGMILQVGSQTKTIEAGLSPVAIVDEIYPTASMGLVYLPYIYL